MSADPAAAAVTSPLPLTVATKPFELAQVTARPDRGLPLPSFGVAVSCTVCPTWIPAEAGVTATEATGTFVTVIEEVPLCPSIVAGIVTEPAATAVTSPLPLTVATDGLELAQLTTRPERGFPLPSFGVAASCTVPPTGTDRK